MQPADENAGPGVPPRPSQSKSRAPKHSTTIPRPESQREAILAALRAGESLTPATALQRFGTPASRSGRASPSSRRMDDRFGACHRPMPWWSCGACGSLFDGGAVNGRGGRRKRRGVPVVGPWLPVGLNFLRSRACAQLSPHAAKLLLDCFALLGAGAARNGDLCLTPRLMAARGWPGRETLRAAVVELKDAGLLVETRQGSRLDCKLWAVALFPLDCDLRKLDVGPGAYRCTDWEGSGELVPEPTEAKPARWNRARKTKSDTSPRAEVPAGSARHGTGTMREFGTSARHGTKSTVSARENVPPRGTYLDCHLHALSSSRPRHHQLRR